MKTIRPHVLVLCVLAAMQLSGITGRLHNALLDLRFDWLSRPASGTVAVVAIDSPSLDRIGLWPWPRALHGKVLEQLDAAGASEIFFDVDFSSASIEADDRTFAEALRSAGSSVVLPSFEQPAGDRLHITRPLPQFAEHAWSALVNLRADGDGIVRRYPFGGVIGGGFVPSMGALMAGRFDSKAAPLWIDFGIRPQTLPQVSYADVLSGDADAKRLLKDKKVIIGATALELGDRLYVPNGRIVSGPVLQALAAESIIQGRALQEAPTALPLAAIALLVLVTAMTWRRLGPFPKVALLGAAAGVAEAVAFYVQAGHPVIVPTATFHIVIGGYLAAVALDEIDVRGWLRAIAETRFERIAMSLGDGLVCADFSRKITVWNPGAAAIFGYTRDEITGRPLATLFGNDDWLKAVLAFPSPSGLPGAASSRGSVIELTGLRKNGEAFPLEACFSQWQGSDGAQCGAILRDISERKREAARIRYLAEYDTLTSLANRYTLSAKLAELLALPGTTQTDFALLIVGIDKFQQINEVHGHHYGDQVIRSAADRIKALVTSDEVVARLGADEFAIVITRQPLRQTIEAVASAVSSSFNDNMLQVGNRLHRVSVSIGIANRGSETCSADELLGNAHLALSKAKVDESDYVFFERAFRDDLQGRLHLEGELYLAVERGEFELFYQPQINLQDGKVVGAEALIRWRHPERGLLAPGQFMPVVNASPISEAVANWVLETACRQCRAWQVAGTPLRVGINLSPSQLQSGDLDASVLDVLMRTECPPHLFELEVTEDILLMNSDAMIEGFRKLQELGIAIAFDDFGTGYASMSHLKNFPLNTLKIDKSFVFDLFKDTHNLPIVGLTINMCHALGLSVIAEGIEDKKTADQLASMGCTEGQGYYFGKPMPVAEFEQKFFVAAPEKAAASAA